VLPATGLQCLDHCCLTYRPWQVRCALCQAVNSID
jgi:hypothetical protein